MPAPEPRYAEALLSVAKNAQEADEIGKALEDFSGMMRENGEFKWFLLNPIIAANGKKDTLKKLLPENIPENAAKFLYLLIDKSRLVNLPKILIEYNRMKAERDDTLIVEITSSEPLEARQTEEISKLCLKKASAASTQIKTIVDPAVIGGIRVRIGDTVIDDTLAGRLERLGSAISMNQ